MIINDLDSLKKALQYIEGHKTIVIPIPINKDETFGFYINDISSLYIYSMDEDMGFLVPVYHYENIIGNNAEIKNIISSYLKPGDKSFILNKRYAFHYEYLLSSLKDLMLNVLFFKGKLYNLSLYDKIEYKYKFPTEKYNFYSPLFEHIEYAKNVIDYYKDELVISHKSYDKYSMYDYMYFYVFYNIEKNGMSIDMNVFKNYIHNTDNIKDGIVYNSYNLYNFTGRPTNSTNGLNYMALNKKSGIRKSFNSRFNDGLLFQFDFETYHPRLIGNFLKTDFSKNVNFYKLIGSLVKNKSYDSITESDIEVFKKKTFYYLYGDTPKNTNIDFFDILNDFKDYLINYFNNHKYILTYHFKRRIYIPEDKKINKNVLFNYFVQSLETERNIIRIYKILKFLEENNISSKIVLYLYDSIMIDLNVKEDYNFLKKIKYILENNKYKVSMKYGKIYDNLIDLKK